MKFAIKLLVSILILNITIVYAQEQKISPDNLIKLKQAGFSEESLQKLIIAVKLEISVDEMIKLKKANIEEVTILKMGIKDNSDLMETGKVKEGFLALSIGNR